MNRNLWLGAVVAQQLKNIDIAVEVGVWRGEYSNLIANALLPKKFYGVDPYIQYEEYEDQPSAEYSDQASLDRLYSAVDNFYKKLPNAELLRMTGNEAAEQFEDNSIDFVYIDGAHTYEFVNGDIKAWYPKIKSGGIISGHDYTEGNPQKGHKYGVIEAVDEFSEREGITIQTTNEEYATWWGIKP